MSATSITVIGNISSEVTLAFSPSGHAVTNFTVASSDRYQDKATNEWKDGKAAFIRCAVWRKPGENAAESLVTGSRVVVVGKLRTRGYTDSNGELRQITELDVEEVAASLKFATAAITKNTRTSSINEQHVETAAA